MSSTFLNPILPTQKFGLYKTISSRVSTYVSFANPSPRSYQVIFLNTVPLSLSLNRTMRTWHLKPPGSLSGILTVYLLHVYYSTNAYMYNHTLKNICILLDYYIVCFYRKEYYPSKTFTLSKFFELDARMSSNLMMSSSLCSWVRGRSTHS